jgi:hypothetical protein
VIIHNENKIREKLARAAALKADEDLQNTEIDTEPGQIR